MAYITKFSLTKININDNIEESFGTKVPDPSLWETNSAHLDWDPLEPAPRPNTIDPEEFFSNDFWLFDLGMPGRLVPSLTNARDSYRRFLRQQREIVDIEHLPLYSVEFYIEEGHRFIVPLEDREDEFLNRSTTYMSRDSFLAPVETWARDVHIPESYYSDIRLWQDYVDCYVSCNDDEYAIHLDGKTIVLFTLPPIEEYGLAGFSF
jgi:hypothetical protein